MGALGVGASSGVAGGVLAVEVCAPLLLLCWLCCWPDDASSESSSTGKHPRKAVVGHGTQSGPRRRASELLGRRVVASSAVSLHLPGTSGSSKQLAPAHRSHEEIPRRRRSHHEPVGDQDGRYHSAPSVIDEVLHRRDWDRSTKELYIPLRPDDKIDCHSETPSPEPQATCSNDESIVEHKEKITCKKHYTNIKSSKNKLNKESNKDDVKDTDATESGSFYIGETRDEPESREEAPELVVNDDKIKSVYKAKPDKQSFNESIKVKERPIGPVAEDYEQSCSSRWSRESVRSGAWHSAAAAPHDPDPPRLHPPPSVALVGYEGAACYLSEEPPRGRGRRDPPAGGPTWPRAGAPLSARARHASDGDILAPTHRPESGAFSESDLDLEPESEDLPPPYHELEECVAATATHSHSHTETAI